ncbi:MAG: ribonuclease H-like domain-containing protein, partial [Anaerolineales bacterium]|nr:ribonuclease H-like domain-containing protein [Anaerolineales bacterium]
MPTSDLRARLQRLRPASRRPQATEQETRNTPSALRELTYEPIPELVLPGVEQHTPYGAFQLIEERYPLTYRHGRLSFAALLAQQPETLARLARAPQFAVADLHGLAFLDTETTSLGTGAGTLAFLIGVGLFEDDAFVLRQYFLRRPDEEPAMLTQLLQDLKPCSGWVTFNGRAFDLPLLETRLTLNRRRSALFQRPHLDLLPLARWLYRGRLDSCALSSLERHVLGVLRTANDVPGELIPLMYVNYLRTGRTHEMRRVLYHNAMDILSMVTLAAHLLEVFAAEADSRVQTTDGGPQMPVDGRWTAVGGPRSPEDWLRLALWHDRGNRPAEAEAAYRRALTAKLSPEDRRTALLHLAALLKRLNRRAEAAPLWEQLASFT